MLVSLPLGLAAVVRHGPARESSLQSQAMVGRAAPAWNCVTCTRAPSGQAPDGSLAMHGVVRLGRYAGWSCWFQTVDRARVDACGTLTELARHKRVQRARN